MLGQPVRGGALPAEVQYAISWARLGGWRPCADGYASVVVWFLDGRAIIIDGRSCAPGAARDRRLVAPAIPARYLPRDARSRGTVTFTSDELPDLLYSSDSLARTGEWTEDGCGGLQWRPDLFTVNLKPLGFPAGWWVMAISMCADGPG